ncbi:MAG: alpha/beta fold hydrolase [Bacillota bacterium]
MNPTARLQVRGVLLHYLEAGSGEPVLLLHGVNGGAGCWSATVAALAPHARAIAPDLPGWGDTPPPHGFTYTMPDLTRFCFELLDGLGIDRVTLVGWSFGGNLAIQMAAARPERVKRLDLVAPGGLDASAHWSFRVMAIPGVGEYLMRPTIGNIRAGLDALTYLPRSLPAELEAYLCRVGRNPWFGATTLRWIRRNRVALEGARRISVQHLLPQLRLPVRVLWGEEDPLVPPAQADLVRLIPGATVTLLPRCGHLPMWEQQEAFHDWLVGGMVGGDPAPSHFAGAIGPS